MKKISIILVIFVISPFAFSSTFLKGTLQKRSAEADTFFTELPDSKVPFPKPRYEVTALFIENLEPDLSKKSDTTIDLKKYNSILFNTQLILKSYDKATHFYKFELIPKTSILLVAVNTATVINKDKNATANILINGSPSCFFEGKYDYLRKELFPTKNTCGINIKIRNKRDYKENFGLIVEKDIPISVEIT